MLNNLATRKVDDFRKNIMQVLSDAVEKLIDEKLDKGESFTAYDLTKELRDKSTSNVFHTAVRSAVAYVFNKTNKLQRKLKTLMNNADMQVQAWEYSSKVPFLPPVPPTVPTDTTPVPKPSFPSLSNLEYRHVDGRGTLAIPVEMLRAVGLKPGDKVIARCEIDETLEPYLEVLALNPQIKEGVLYTVDRSGNVRITRNTLRTQGAGSGMTYRLQLHNDSIRVDHAY